MDKLQIASGKKRIQITDENDKEKGVLEFNPSEMVFIEKYQTLMIGFQEKSIIIEKLLEDIKSRIGKGNFDEGGDETREVSKSAFETIKELYDFFDNELNILFGEGTTAMLFSTPRDLGEYNQFLEGISPYIQEVRAKKVEKYASPRVKGKKK